MLAEERFENTDGTDIVFDSDYFGDHRGAVVVPGPFASADELTRPVVSHADKITLSKIIDTGIDLIKKQL